MIQSVRQLKAFYAIVQMLSDTSPVTGHEFYFYSQTIDTIENRFIMSVSSGFPYLILERSLRECIL